MRVIIAGSRSIRKYKVIERLIKECPFYDQITEIVSGGAAGVDSMAIHFATKHDIPYKVFHADWETYGKKAGMIRNGEMAKYSDMLIAIWDYKSKGTRDIIKRVRKSIKPYYVVILDSNSLEVKNIMYRKGGRN